MSDTTTYDIHFEILTLQQPAPTLPFGFGFVSAVGVRGPQLVINRWVKCFLTTKGSDSFEQTYGTNFNLLQGSNVVNEQDISDAIAIAIEDCNTQIRAFDTTNSPPDDETFANAVVAALIWNTTGDGFNLYVVITNAAGTQVQVGLPSVIVS